MSVAALALVLGHVAIFKLIAGQVPVVAYFALKWLPRFQDRRYSKVNLRRRELQRTGLRWFIVIREARESDAAPPGGRGEIPWEETMDVAFSFLLLIVLVIMLYVVLASFFTVKTAQVAVITRFGKFLRVAEPGLNWKVPLFDSVAGSVSLRVNQITLTMETKTKDNVFVTIPISVQNMVRPDRVYDAFYKLSDPTAQIKSYVEQVILGHVPGMTLDEVFASQSSIAAAVKKELDADMSTFGYEIVNVLVTDIVPDEKVKSAMNDINAAQREQVAANARGEAEKILVVKRAEAEAESKALQGQGIANQRRAIIEGLQGSIEQFQKVVEGASAKEVMQLVMVTQYFDTLKAIGESAKTNTLFLSHSPGAVKDVGDQILESMLVAGQAK